MAPFGSMVMCKVHLLGQLGWGYQHYCGKIVPFSP